MPVGSVSDAVNAYDGSEKGQTRKLVKGVIIPNTLNASKPSPPKKLWTPGQGAVHQARHDIDDFVDVPLPPEPPTNCTALEAMTGELVSSVKPPAATLFIDSWKTKSDANPGSLVVIELSFNHNHEKGKALIEDVRFFAGLAEAVNVKYVSPGPFGPPKLEIMITYEEWRALVSNTNLPG